MATTESALTWAPSKGQGPQYVLTDNGRVVASIRYQGLGSLAIGEFEGKAVSLKREDLLNPSVSIRKLDFDTDLATLRLYSSLRFLGELEFTDGRKLFLARPELTDMLWSFRHPDGRVLCRFDFRFNFLMGRKGATGNFYTVSNGSNDPELYLLAIIGWYAAILIQSEQDALGTVFLSS